MKRLALVLLMLAMSLPGSFVASAATQPAASPSPEATSGPVSDPVTVGDWTFQVVELERRESYYGENFAEVFEPQGVYLIVGVAITYNGSSTNELDRYTGGFFTLTTASGAVYDQPGDVAAQFAIEESYHTDEYPYPPLASNGVAEPGVTVFTRFIYDVPPDATGLALASGPLAPEPFAIPLPDPDDIAGQEEWALEVLDALLYETLAPPLTGSNRYEPEGIYLVVDVELTRLQETPARIDANWFSLRTADGAMIPVASDETIDLGVPIDAEGGARVGFALVFDVPPGLDGATLVTNPGSPLSVEIPLNPDVAPTPAPTPSPTPTSTTPPTPTLAPAATTVPTATATPEPTVSSEPGAIRVVSADGGTAMSPNVGGAVELILDTSGSMLQPMAGGLRIDVARQVLTDVVTTQLPPGTQTALRVFGTVPGSCDTSLAIPLGPLDPASAASTVASIGAINEVRTPLGASLEAAGADLAGVEGPKLIVLITDGEETCDGDPGAVIDALVAQGIDIRVNIVGFAIDDPAIEESLAAWAEQGGGQYFPAADAGDLGPALGQALQPPFEVRDSDGFTVATSIVNGEAVPVPAGEYTVVVNTAQPTTIEEVVVEPAKTTEVTVSDGG